MNLRAISLMKNRDLEELVFSTDQETALKVQMETKAAIISREVREITAQILTVKLSPTLFSTLLVHLKRLWV